MRVVLLGWENCLRFTLFYTNVGNETTMCNGKCFKRGFGVIMASVENTKLNPAEFSTDV